MATPERPWSPSVPAALTTQGLVRRRTKDRETEKQDNVGARQTKSSSPTPAPPISPPHHNGFSTKLEPAFATSFASGCPMPAVPGKPSNHPSPDEDNKVLHQTSTHPSGRTNSFTPALAQILLPTDNPHSPPSVAPRFVRSDVALPPTLLSVEGHSTHPRSPELRRDQSPSRLSPVSSRGSFSYGPIENSATNIPPHISSPKMSVRKPATFSWPPFRPNLDEGSTDFDPPFRAGQETFCEPPPPPPFRPTSGPATVRTYMACTPGRPAVISSSNSIPIVPRHSSCIPPSGSGGPSSPTVQPFNSQSFNAPPISPQPPLRPLQGTVPDGNYTPRQPRSDAAMQAMAPTSVGQGVPRSQPQYHRQREYLIIVAADRPCAS